MVKIANTVNNFDWVTYMTANLPNFKWVLFGFIVLIFIVAIAWLMLRRKPRKIHTPIFEEGSDGRLVLISWDILKSESLNFGRQIIFKFVKARVESIPPSDKQIFHFNKMEICPYIRVLNNNYAPATLKVKVNNESLIQKVKNGLIFIHTHSKQEVEYKYYYAPLDLNYESSINVNTLSYELEVMRANMTETINKKYADKMTILQQILPWILLGIAVIGTCVLWYMNMSYTSEMISKVLNSVDALVPHIQVVSEAFKGSSPPV